MAKEEELEQEEEVNEAEGKDKKKTDDTPYDPLLKRLADHFGPELLAYLHETEPLKSCESVGGEVEITHRLSDRFWKVTHERDGREHTCLMHVEFESSYDANIGRRLGMYGWGVYQKEKLPVLHLVWWVGTEKPSYWPEGAWYRYRNLDMAPLGEVTAWLKWREVWLPGGHQAESFIQEAPPYLLPFAAKMEKLDKALLLRLHDAIMNAQMTEDQRQDLLVMAIFFASEKKENMAYIREVFDMSVLERNPLAREIKQEGRQEERKKIAWRLLKQGVDVETILNATGLTKEELEEIKEPQVGAEEE